MLNVPELERQWLRYKTKSFIKPIGITTGIILFILSMSLYLLHTKSENKAPKISNTEHNKTIHIIKDSTQMERNTTKSDNETLVLHPSLNFVDNINDSKVQIENPDSASIKPKKIDLSSIQKPTENKLSQVPTNEVEKISPLVIPKVTTTQTSHSSMNVKPTKMEIEVRNSDDDLQDVIERFKKTNNPTLGIFLAKRYYDLHNYDQAYNYALLTNQINSKLDMSWIIFSKSLVKLGKKDMAISTLKTYIKNSNSPQAITLLDEIETGRFK